MKNFAASALGLQSLLTSTVNMEKLFKETVPTEPVLFVVSPGADPSSDLRELVDKVGVVDRNQFYEVCCSDIE